MNKILAITILGLILFSNLSAQYVHWDPILVEKEIFQNRYVFLNRKFINPALISNQGKLRFDMGLSYNGYMGVNDLYLSNEFAIKSINSNFGLTVDSKNYSTSDINRYNSYTFSYSYDKKLNENSGIQIGLNLGLTQYNIIQPQPSWGTSQETGIKNAPFSQIGAIYYSNNHTIGISTKPNESKITETNPEFIYLGRALTVNYSYKHSFSDKLSIYPEIIVDYSYHELKGVAAIRLNYSKKILSGLLYTTKNDIGFYFQGYLGDHFAIGYYLDGISPKNWNMNIYSHSLNFTLSY